jgi:SAM-dependent methyltransferase
VNGIGAWWRRRASRRYWEREWAQDDYAPPWLGRGVSREVAAALDEGWLERGARALDIGCGQGEIAAWLAEHGLPVLGIDIAESALARARARYGEHAGRLEFRRADICAAALAPRHFAALVDRGCFHQLSDENLRAYAKNVARASTPDARLLLFVKAFRDGAKGLGTDTTRGTGEEPAGAAGAHGAPLAASSPAASPLARGGRATDDSRESALATMAAASPERARQIQRVEAALGRDFTIERVAPTFLDPHDGHAPAARLPGLVFWMRRGER